MNINDFEDIFIKLSKNHTLTLTQILYISRIIVNLISVIFLNKKNIKAYFSFNKSAYLNYFDQHVTFANNVHKQYLLKIEINTIMNLREQKSKHQQQIQKKLSHYFAVFKKITDLKTWHRHLIHLNYKNIIANRKNVKEMKKVSDSVSDTLCKSCMKSKQQITLLRHSMQKATKFLKRIHVNIKKSLFIIFRSNKYFLLIKNDAFKIFFVYVIKFKDEISSRFQQFWT